MNIQETAVTETAENIVSTIVNPETDELQAEINSDDNFFNDSFFTEDAAVLPSRVTAADVGLTDEAIKQMSPKEIISEDVIDDATSITNPAEQVAVLSKLRTQARKFGYDKVFQRALEKHATKVVKGDVADIPMWQRAKRAIEALVKEHKEEFAVSGMNNRPTNLIGAIKGRAVKIKKAVLCGELETKGILFDSVKRTLASDGFLIKPNEDHYSNRTSIDNDRDDYVQFLLSEPIY